MSITRIPVEGMTCGHCQASVTEALSDVPGVVSVTVSLDDRSATVEHSDAFAEDAAHAAIREVGYRVGA